MIAVEYPRTGIVPNDIVDIPRQTFRVPARDLRLRVGEIYTVSTYPMVAFTGEDLATGRQVTVWVDPAWAQVALPEPSAAHELPRAS